MIVSNYEVNCLVKVIDGSQIENGFFDTLEQSKLPEIKFEINSSFVFCKIKIWIFK